MQNALDILQKYWKHQSFREPQLEIINSVLKNNDTFALLPTGGGKSVCFQIPALMMPGVCLVISPLIALIEDQVKNLNNKGIKATAIFGGSSMSDIDAVFDNCLFGNYKFLYISPERLQQTWILERIENLRINLIAIDEAHCISQWGHDFRPAYLQLSKLKDIFTDTPTIALTASANKRVINDICTILRLKDPKIFTKSFYRSNIIYGVYKVESKLNTLEKILKKNTAPTIIYARNRRETQMYSDHLNNLGYSATFFHGGLPINEKKKRLQSWLEEKTLIMVSTNAFGMGIDKHNVKNVVHIQIPENIENYYQESGRAGRNNQKAFATILISGNELAECEQTFLKGLFDKEYLKKIYRKLNNFLKIAYGEGFNTTHSFNFNHFCLHYKFNYKQAFNALQFLDRQGIIKFTHDNNNKTKLLFTVNSGELLDAVDGNEREESILYFILRYYQGIHEFETDLDLNLISEHVDLPIEFIVKSLESWNEMGICEYTPEVNDMTIVFNEAWEEDRPLYRTFPFLEQQNTLKTNQFKSMLFYIENTDICKNKILLKYFDEVFLEDCGSCSACIEKSRAQKLDNHRLKEQILLNLADNPATIEELSLKTQMDQNDIILGIQLLLEENKIIVNNKNQYTLLI
ncbi:MULTISPECIES: ATP-dependent DNA helicase RecQ [Myroides]|uniref:ATP-dependent DNA helicase RecQ n=1 Tax=Myroides albus TaxID=2562892 RepID=A0A6I3LIW1_9FLAO|nr:MULTISPECIES: RecQ family ATP-dependent DNA helicase [Myroides]MTG97754.1 RecQ family ATP-dependent DNA helicase [Myroides albus]MVX37040.1 RecQ family ATP-dependent DNA helicase [Myroides sp. LoEW2-1]UVD78697.1 RecQ family ATP-dependent DNA helicase [Myroides albus]